MKPIAERLTTEVPPKMRLLPRDRRGYPVPWIVQRDLTGRPFFVINDTEKVAACARRGLCGICGRKLERDAWLVGGPAAAFHKHGAYLDPAMHKACATYALQVCPYIAAPYSARIDAALAKHGKWPANLRMVQEADESDLPEQPPFFVLAKPKRVETRDTGRGTFRFHPTRPWLAWEFWRHGAQITEAEARALLASSHRREFHADELAYWPQEAAHAG